MKKSVLRSQGQLFLVLLRGWGRAPCAQTDSTKSKVLNSALKMGEGRCARTFTSNTNKSCRRVQWWWFGHDILYEVRTTWSSHRRENRTFDNAESSRSSDTPVSRSIQRSMQTQRSMQATQIESLREYALIKPSFQKLCERVCFL